MRLTNAYPANKRGKGAWRHLRDDERAMLARHAAKHGRKATIEKFGISNTLVDNCCAKFGLRPARHKYLDLRAIAAGSKGMSREDAATKFRVSVTTITTARKRHPEAYL